MARTLWGWTVIVVSTVVFGTLALLTSVVPPRGRLFLFWARLWARVLFHGTGVPTRVEVAAGVRGVRRAIFMANHESTVDIPLLLTAVPLPVRFAAKRSLFYVPFLGWSMWLAGFVPVDRERADRARDAFRALERRLLVGYSLVVFPEGTRSRDGALHEFKKAGFLVALKAGVPIVPVAITGARDVLVPGSLTIRPRKVTIRIGDPIPTEGLGMAKRAELMARVRSAIEGLRNG